ncbi:MAG TPA: hypothetical protein DEQ47_20215 [Solibacterales bacterium]|nr:hypothetical protein [Bryobacterales bacterium]
MRYSALLLVVSFCAFSANAQVPVQPPSTDSKNTTDPTTPPGVRKSKDKEAVPGTGVSTDDSTVTGTEKTVPSEPDYPGPGTLGHNFSIAPASTKSVRFRPYLGVSGIFASGLTGGQINPDGSIASARSWGIEGDYGITGIKVREKDEFSLDFHGNVFHYMPDSNFDGSNNFLSASYTRQLRPHLLVRFDDSAGVYSNNFGVASTAATTDISLGNTNTLVTPSSQILDNRTYYLSTSADVVSMLSPRVTLDFGGSAFEVKRQSSALIGSVGEQARADAEYRMSRRSTVGLYYGYTHYEYTRAFGGSDVHTLGLSYSVGVTKRLEMRFRAGASRIESLNLAQVALDPLVALLIGRTTGEVAMYQINYIPDFSAQVVRTFNHAVAGAEASLSVSPGNGLLLTSKRHFYNAHLDYTGLRTYSISMGATREELAGIGVSFANFSSSGANFGISRELKHGVQANFRAEYRHYDISSLTGFLRNQYKLMVGLTYSPGDRPINIW